MELIPLLIIVLGIVSSIIGSKNNKEKEGGRNIDTAPRSRQPDTRTSTNEQKGFFQTLQEAFDEEFNQPEQETKQQSKTESKPQPVQASGRESRPDRQASERPVRETIQQARGRQNLSQNISDIEKRITDRTKREDLGRDIGNKSGYSDGDVLTQKQKSEHESTNITSDDLAFDSKAVLNGIIMSEVLGKPKSKQKSTRKLG